MANRMTVEVDGQKIIIELVTVTPEMASEWLKRNEHNRNKKPKQLAKITRSMDLGEFRFAGDPIRFDKKQRLIDGQHRLTAIVRSGEAQPLLVMSGFDEEIQMHVDQNSVRQAGDQVMMFGPADKGGNNWASIARLIIRWDAGDLVSNILVPSNVEIVAFCEEHPDQMRRAVTAANSQYRRVGTRKPVVGAVHFFAEEIDAALCAEFFRTFATGEGLHAGDPVFALRDTLLKRRQVAQPGVNELIALFARAWNAKRRGQTLQRVQLPREGFKPDSFDLR